jgi:hypothetical protein
MDQLMDQLDAMGALGALNVRPLELPSTTLHVRVTAGVVRLNNNTRATVAAVPTLTVITATTNYVYVNDSGAVVTNTTGWPAANVAPLAIVTTDATRVLTIVDQRNAQPTFGVTPG